MFETTMMTFKLAYVASSWNRSLPTQSTFSSSGYDVTN